MNVGSLVGANKSLIVLTLPLLLGVSHNRPQLQLRVSLGGVPSMHQVQLSLGSSSTAVADPQRAYCSLEQRNAAGFNWNPALPPCRNYNTCEPCYWETIYLKS